MNPKKGADGLPFLSKIFLRTQLHIQNFHIEVLTWLQKVTVSSSNILSELAELVKPARRIKPLKDGPDNI
jgi:hypothetical protein